MSKADGAAARHKAQELLSRAKRAEEERLQSRDRQRREEDAKIAQLRTLRLAKEAADKAALDAAKPRASAKGGRLARNG